MIVFSLSFAVCVIIAWAVWISYEIKTAPTVDKNGNILDEKEGNANEN